MSTAIFLAQIRPGDLVTFIHDGTGYTGKAVRHALTHRHCERGTAVCDFAVDGPADTPCVVVDIWTSSISWTERYVLASEIQCVQSAAELAEAA